MVASTNHQAARRHTAPPGALPARAAHAGHAYADADARLSTIDRVVQFTSSAASLPLVGSPDGERPSSHQYFGNAKQGVGDNRESFCSFVR